MKVRFFCDSGANIESCREQVFDTDDGDTIYGHTEEEWLGMEEAEREEIVTEWANDRLDIGYHGLG